MTITPEQLQQKMSEEDLLACVLDVAKRFGWLVCHIRPARVMIKGVETWRTPYQGDNFFPDLCLARNGVVLLAELKSSTGKVSDGQREWLIAAHGDEWESLVLRPADWFSGRIEEMMK